MLRPWLFPGIAGLVLLLLCCIGYLVMAGLRTWNLAKCWYCGAGKVRPSKSQSWHDTLVGAFFLKPYRCGGCLKRFYGFRTAPADQALPTPAVVASFAPPPRQRLRIRVRVVIKVPDFTTWDSFWEWATALQDVADEPRDTRRARSASAGT